MGVCEQCTPCTVHEKSQKFRLKKLKKKKATEMQNVLLGNAKRASQTHTKCMFGSKLKSQLILLFSLFLVAKMAKYHIFWKVLAKKHCFGNKWQTTTFSRTWVLETWVPHQFCYVALLSWICAIKKNYVVLQHGKLEYHATQYSSIPSSGTFYK